MSYATQSSTPFTTYHSEYENPKLITHFRIWPSRNLNEIQKWFLNLKSKNYKTHFQNQNQNNSFKYILSKSNSNSIYHSFKYTKRIIVRMIL